jgi:tripartite-type tricarboxylate transporter receptor subunit TctC
MVDSSGGSLKRRSVLRSALLLAGAPLSRMAQAQGSAKTARLVVGFAAGGNGDTLARGLADSLKDFFPGGLVVENRPGASGRLAVDAVKSSEPDGLTLLYSPAALFTILPHAVKGGAFQPLSWLTPIAAVSKQDFAVAVNPGTGVTTLAALLNAAKTNPQLQTYGTAGAGTPQHLIGHLLSTSGRVNLTHVPYKGGTAALQDTIGGHTPICITAISEQVSTLAAEGKLRIVAVAGAKRSALLPTVPTIQEQGLRDVVVEDWSGVLGPAHLPPAVLQRLSERILQITSTPAYRAAMARMGQEPLSVDATSYASRLKEENQRWAPIVKAAGFNLDS